MNLFQYGNFKLHSGRQSNFKIDCDALTEEDIKTLAMIISDRFKYHDVYGIPKGGERLAKELKKYCGKEGPMLIVDDVLTTGNSMEELRKTFLYSTGVVIFARGICPGWITPLFRM